MKYGHIGIEFGKHKPLIGVIFTLLFLASTSFASPILCTPGATLEAYISTGACYVAAGNGVNLLFSFDPLNTFGYQTDNLSVLTAADITVTPVTGPGSPQAGLFFQTSLFQVIDPGTFADITLVFNVSVLSQPGGYNYLFNSAHLGLTGTFGPANGSFITVAEDDQLLGFSLGLSNPPSPDDVPDTTYPVQLQVSPSTDLLINFPQSQITNWTESFDLVNIPEPGSWVLITGGMVLLALLRGRRHAKAILPLFALVIFSAAQSSATPLCTDLSTINGAPTGAPNLAVQKYIDYTTNFGGCLMNDMLFKFTAFTSSGTGHLATAALTPLIFSHANATPFDGTQAIQLQYNAVQFTILSTDTNTLSFQYSVTAPTYKITNFIGSTSYTPVSGSGITRTVTITGGTPNPAVSLATSILLSNPLNTQIFVTDTFNLAAGAQIKHISSATDKFTEVVPEPSTTLLLGSALFGIGFLTRKRRA